MAHTRTRFLTPLVKKGLTFKGIVGIFGHRQVGPVFLNSLRQVSVIFQFTKKNLGRNFNPDESR